MGFPPSGLCSTWRSRARLRARILPCRWTTSKRHPRLRRFDPSKQAKRTGRNRTARSALLAFFPSEALPLAAGETVSRLFLSRASDLASASLRAGEPANRNPEPESVHLRVSPCGEPVSRSGRKRPDRHRPLWGFPTSSFPVTRATTPERALSPPKGRCHPREGHRQRASDVFSKTLRREPHLRR